MNQFTSAGLALLKEFEGCSLTSYQDGGGRWTIGYGHAEGVKPGESLTNELAAASLLVEDLLPVVSEVRKCIQWQLTDDQFSAVVCFAYNVGIGNLKQSTLLKCINSGHLSDAANEFTKWVKINGIESEGLLRRRNAEKTLFLTAAPTQQVEPKVVDGVI